MIGIVWIVIFLLFLLSFVSVIYPLIPGAFVIWVGFILYHLIIDGNKLSLLFWITMSILTLILVTSDIIASSYFVKRFGGSKWGERSAGIAIIVGSFIWPPFGILIIPFITVLIIELIQRRTMKHALFSSVGSFIGFLSGVIAKIVVQSMMILWFIIVIL